MSEQTKQLLNKFIEQAELQLGFFAVEDLDTRVPSSQYHIAKSAFSDLEYPVDALYFSGNMPVICFKELRSFDPEQIRGLHRKVWNEGIIPFLMIVTPQDIRVYDCFDTPKKERGAFKELEIECFQNTKNDLDRLCSLLHQSKIDSGIIWKEEFGKHLKTHNRVDRKLIGNLAATRDELFEKYNFPLNIIHDLLGRSLFTLYLEDRKILTAENYPLRPQEVSNFFDLLGYSDATYALFTNLKEKFNGDLFPVTEEEVQLVKKHPQCLDLVKLCFSGHLEITTGQYTLPWRMFQFQYIPIELISSIYEEFMSEED